MTGGAYNCLTMTHADIYCHKFSFLRLAMYRTWNFKKGTNKNDRKIQMKLNYGIRL